MKLNTEIQNLPHLFKNNFTAEIIRWCHTGQAHVALDGCMPPMGRLQWCQFQDLPFLGSPLQSQSRLFWEACSWTAACSSVWTWVQTCVGSRGPWPWGELCCQSFLRVWPPPNSCFCCFNCKSHCVIKMPETMTETVINCSYKILWRNYPHIKTSHVLMLLIKCCDTFKLESAFIIRLLWGCAEVASRFTLTVAWNIYLFIYLFSQLKKRKNSNVICM